MLDGTGEDELGPGAGPMIVSTATTPQNRGRR
jgi:hypothetical protein